MGVRSFRWVGGMRGGIQFFVNVFRWIMMIMIEDSYIRMFDLFGLFGVPSSFFEW